MNKTTGKKEPHFTTTTTNNFSVEEVVKELHHRKDALANFQQLNGIFQLLNSGELPLNEFIEQLGDKAIKKFQEGYLEIAALDNLTMLQGKNLLSAPAIRIRKEPLYIDTARVEIIDTHTLVLLSIAT